MRIGLCGSHRSGKTTLAKQLASSMGLTFVPSQVSSIARDYDFNMDEDRRDDIKFFAMQKSILEHIRQNAMYGAQEGRGRVIMDRTPLDAAAYLMADIQANTGNFEFQEDVLQYVDAAIRMTNQHFDAIIIVPPGIDFDPADGKPGGNLAYQEHHHLICSGLANELTIPNGMLERDNLDLTDRVDAVEAYLMQMGLNVFGEAA